MWNQCHLINVKGDTFDWTFNNFTGNYKNLNRDWLRSLHYFLVYPYLNLVIVCGTANNLQLVILQKQGSRHHFTCQADTQCPTPVQGTQCRWVWKKNTQMGNFILSCGKYIFIIICKIWWCPPCALYNTCRTLPYFCCKLDLHKTGIKYQLHSSGPLLLTWFNYYWDMDK